MEEKSKSGQQSSGNNYIEDPELKSLIDDMKNALDDEDEIIELTEVVEIAGAVKSVEHEQIIIMKDLEEDICSDEYIKDDFAASLGMKIGSELDTPAEGLIEDRELDLKTESQKDSGEPAISPQQLEAAIESVVQRMLGDKIDDILIEVIERAVKQEIIRLKNVLRLEEDDID